MPVVLTRQCSISSGANLSELPSPSPYSVVIMLLGQTILLNQAVWSRWISFQVVMYIFAAMMPRASVRIGCNHPKVCIHTSGYIFRLLIPWLGSLPVKSHAAIQIKAHNITSGFHRQLDLAGTSRFCLFDCFECSLVSYMCQRLLTQLDILGAKWRQSDPVNKKSKLFWRPQRDFISDVEPWCTMHELGCKCLLYERPLNLLSVCRPAYTGCHWIQWYKQSIWLVIQSLDLMYTYTSALKQYAGFLSWMFAGHAML